MLSRPWLHTSAKGAFNDFRELSLTIGTNNSSVINSIGNTYLLSKLLLSTPALKKKSFQKNISNACKDVPTCVFDTKSDLILNPLLAATPGQLSDEKDFSEELTVLRAAPHCPPQVSLCSEDGPTRTEGERLRAALEGGR